MSEDSGKPVSSSSSTISRISSYPVTKSPLRREIHAPSRGIHRYWLRSSLPDQKGKPNYYCCDNDGGTYLDALSLDEEVIDFGDELENEAISEEDSSIEEIVAIDCDEESTDLDALSLDEEVIDFGDELENEASSEEDSSIEEVVAIDCDDERTDLDALRFLKNDKEVVGFGDETENEASSEDSSFEEVEVIACHDEGTDLDALSLRFLKKVKGLIDFGDETENEACSLDSNVEEVTVIDCDEEKLVDERVHDIKNGRVHDISTMLASLSIDRRQVKVPHEPFTPLTEEEEALVSSAFSRSNRSKVLATHENSNIVITGVNLQCLRPSSWLNDEVINVYLELLKERETREPKNYLKCHFFNTFFYRKLVSDSGYNYKAVKRWTTQQKLGCTLIDCDMIFVPINRGNHWTLAVINNKDCKFMYLDSLNGVDSDSMILNSLARYLSEEANEKSGKNIDVTSWKMEYVEDIPQQQNWYDCGMFMLKYIDFFSRGLGLYFSQEHIKYFRLRTAKEILRLRAD